MHQLQLIVLLIVLSPIKYGKKSCSIHISMPHLISKQLFIPDFMLINDFPFLYPF